MPQRVTEQADLPQAPRDRVARAFSDALGIGVGETTPDGRITLERTACIGMSDQAPAALINETVITNLSPERARQVNVVAVKELLRLADPSRLRSISPASTDMPACRHGPYS